MLMSFNHIDPWIDFFHSKLFKLSYFILEAIMEATLKPMAVELFSAFGKDLKMTKSDMPPYKVGDGQFKLILAMKQYKLSVSGNNKTKYLSFKNDETNEFKHKSRNGQFTFTISINKKPNILCGTFDEKTKTMKIIEILNEILNNKTQSYSKENVLDFKQHDSPHVVKTYQKLSTRQPLKQVKTSTGGQRIFPSSSASEKKAILTNNRRSSDGDCQITAVGARKTSNFYGSKIFRAEQYLRFSEPYKAKVNISKSPSAISTKSNLEVAVVGFENLGNTCYMNSILQCLLNIPNFYQELSDKKNKQAVEHDSLYNHLCNLGYMKKHIQKENMESQKTALKLVKNAISSSAKKFMGYGQHDAHEFLCYCLDQLKEDFITSISKSEIKDTHQECLLTCPIRDNFESTVEHSIKCLGCNEEVVKEEQCNDFSLVIPDKDENTFSQDLGIDKLLQSYFSDELIDYSCETCKGHQSVLSHHFLKLPRVLILHLKRYDIYHVKRSDHIPISKQIILGNKLTLNTTKQPRYFYYKNETEGSITSLGVKRNLSSPTTSDLPRKKVSRPSPGFDDVTNSTNDNCRLGEQLAMAARDSWFADKHKDGNSFTRISNKSFLFESTRRGLDFTPCEKDTSQESVEKCDQKTSAVSFLDENDEELQKALELSMQEYEEEQRSELQKFCPSIKDNKTDTELTSLSAPTCVPHLHDEEISKNNIDNLNGEGHVYKLVGIVNHHGLNSDNGHYTCDCYDFKSKQWRNYNDSSVKDVSQTNIVKSKSAYIVFYMHSSCFQSIASKY